MVSRHADLEGPVHYLDFGGDGPPIVLVHGLSGSALNWMLVGPTLATRYRVLALDLRGFGRTPLGPGTRLRDNLRLLDLFLTEVVGGPAVLVGNSMGGLLSVMQSADRPDTVSSLVLVDPALPWRGRRPFDLSVIAFFAALLPPVAGEAVLASTARRWGAEQVVRGVLAAVCADPSGLREDLVQALVEQETERLARPRSHRALAQASRSLLWALGRRGLMRTYRDVRAPVLVLHGERDRIVPAAFSVAAGRRFGWQVEVLLDVGHVPMMEVPDDFVRLMLGWLTAHEPAAA
ncbi:MAG TPA: alpha/beta hydrolase [Candidatus Dormibacteraeota bacterium]|nr:alpha/beta hydrolase [Candidatus Dormibacteraeota bacterium]